MKWRALGDTTLETFRAMLPLESEIVKRGEVEAVYYSGQPHTRLLLGMLKAESSFATHFNAVPASMKNPLNLRRRGQPSFQSFSSIAACVDEWRDRITSPTYAYKDTVLVHDLVSIYAPSSDNNNVAWYVSTVEGVVRRLPAIREEVSAVSIPVKAPPVEIAITPAGANRPQLEMSSPSYITVHEVGNQSPGADEEMHKRFVHNGGGPSDVSFHFVVGPTCVIQLLPLDEAAWHASDGYYGAGNRDSIAIETIQIGDFDKTLWHLAWLINEIATNPERFFHNKKRQWDMSIERIVQHNHWAPDGKNCPEFIRNRGLWPELMKRVDLWHGAGNGVEVPKYAKPIVPAFLENDNGLRIEYVNKTPFYPVNLVFTALRETPRRQGADPNTLEVGPPLKKGTRFRSPRVYRSGGEVYAVTKNGSRIQAKDLSPEVNISLEGGVWIDFGEAK